MKVMPNKQSKQNSQWQRDVKIGDELDRQRERQEGHAESTEQPGSVADIAKSKRPA